MQRFGVSLTVGISRELLHPDSRGCSNVETVRRSVRSTAAIASSDSSGCLRRSRWSSDSRTKSAFRTQRHNDRLNPLGSLLGEEDAHLFVNQRPSRIKIRLRRCRAWRMRQVSEVDPRDRGQRGNQRVSVMWQREVNNDEWSPRTLGHGGLNVVDTDHDPVRTRGTHDDVGLCQCWRRLSIPIGAAPARSATRFVDSDVRLATVMSRDAAGGEGLDRQRGHGSCTHYKSGPICQITDRVMSEVEGD